MSVISPTTSYVKFIRGTPTAYTNLLNKDADTLYFISAAGASSGTLYLGDKIIGGASSLTQLSDILISAVRNREVLTYDAGSNRWVNTQIESIIGQMTGATDSANGSAGLVPAPAAGDQNKFLRGDGTWVSVSVDGQSFDSKVFSTATGTVTLRDFSSATTGQIPQKNSLGVISWVSPSTFTADLSTAVTNLQNTVNGLQGGIRRTIVADVASIDVNAQDADKFIYMVPNNSQVSSNLYDEYMVIDGAVEKIGVNLSGEIDNYVSNTQFQTAVTNLTNRFNDYVEKTVYAQEVGNLTNLIKSQNNGNTLVDQVNDLTTRLTWYTVQDN